MWIIFSILQLGCWWQQQPSRAGPEWANASRDGRVNEGLIGRGEGISFFAPMVGSILWGAIIQGTYATADKGLGGVTDPSEAKFTQEWRGQVGRNDGGPWGWRWRVGGGVVVG